MGQKKTEGEAFSKRKAENDAPLPYQWGRKKTQVA